MAKRLSEISPHLQMFIEAQTTCFNEVLTTL